MKRAIQRFEPIEGRPLLAMPPFCLEERRRENLIEASSSTWVVVPAFNEGASIRATLEALEAQTLRPLVICVVDNGSTDDTLERVRTWAAHPGLRDGQLGVSIVHEAEKGTGAAADTGMRHAIAQGASFLLRTDADSLPRRDWAARMTDRLESGAELVAGRVVDRPDERLGLRIRLILGLLTVASAIVSVPLNRGLGYRTRFRLLFGSNVGICATTYIRTGGFPRSRIDELHEDRALMNRTRRVTDRIVADHRAIVATSARRYRRYGLRGTINWYVRHDSHGEPVDVR